MPKAPSRSTRKDSARPAQTPRDQSQPVEGKAHRTASMWTREEDEKLLQARVDGLSWQPIADRHFPGKTANACRKRHERLMDRRSQDDWEPTRLEALATTYMECRREMWTILAERLGERWTTIEAKVSLYYLVGPRVQKLIN